MKSLGPENFSTAVDYILHLYKSEPERVLFHKEVGNLEWEAINAKRFGT